MRLVQLVEHQIVVLGVVGSSPTSHPKAEGLPSGRPSALGCCALLSPCTPRGRGKGFPRHAEALLLLSGFALRVPLVGPPSPAAADSRFGNEQAVFSPVCPVCQPIGSEQAVFSPAGAPESPGAGKVPRKKPHLARLIKVRAYTRRRDGKLEKGAHPPLRLIIYGDFRGAVAFLRKIIIIFRRITPL